MTSFTLQILFGIVLAAICIIPGRKFFPQFERPLWAAGLFVAALIYVAFLLLGASGHWLWIEPAGAVVYGGVALLGARRFPMLVGIGWLLHGFWDVGLHLGDRAHFVPYWYPGACLGYDLTAGVYLITRVPAWKDMSSTNPDTLESSTT
ncbi:MAG: hypothetical protein COA73_17325 [Candidatus Hydrogenedentota bacterium]|nr:MAG: hypothetical protein COA73_17325 [Candidatus Hydrogenedentota bacterium]